MLNLLNGIGSLVFFIVILFMPDRSYAGGAPGLQISNGTLNQSVSVTGRIQLAGSNYFLDPRFVIVDDQGNFFPVTSWSPLELNPWRPGTPQPESPSLSTMQDFIGRKLSVTGIHRVGVGNISPIRADAGAQNGFLIKPEDRYLEVQTVIDIETAKVVLKAMPAAIQDVGSNANISKNATGQVIGGQTIAVPNPIARSATQSTGPQTIETSVPRAIGSPATRP